MSAKSLHALRVLKWTDGLPFFLVADLIPTQVRQIKIHEQHDTFLKCPPIQGNILLTSERGWDKPKKDHTSTFE